MLKFFIVVSFYLFCFLRTVYPSSYSLAENFQSCISDIKKIGFLNGKSCFISAIKEDIFLPWFEMIESSFEQVGLNILRSITEEDQNREKYILESDFVVVFYTPQFKNKCDLDRKKNKKTDVDFIIERINKRADEKNAFKFFIPFFISGNEEKSIPSDLRNFLYESAAVKTLYNDFQIDDVAFYDAFLSIVQQKLFSPNDEIINIIDVFNKNKSNFFCDTDEINFYKHFFETIGNASLVKTNIKKTCFLSRCYTGEDRRILFLQDAINDLLQRAGMICIYDVNGSAHGLEIGADAKEFMRKIISADYVLATYSNAYKKRSQLTFETGVKIEVDLICERLKSKTDFFIPLLLEENELESIPQELQKIDVFLDSRTIKLLCQSLLFFLLDIVYKDIHEVQDLKSKIIFPLQSECYWKKFSPFVTVEYPLGIYQISCFEYDSYILSTIIDQSKETYFERLQTFFHPFKEGVKSVLCGMGGCGKTQLALKYCTWAKELKLYDIIFSIQAETLSSIQKSFKILYFLMLDKPEFSEKLKMIDENDCTEQILEILDKSNYKYLIFYDNVENIDFIINNLPSKGHFLITTRCEESLWDSAVFKTICVNPFHKSDAIRYYESRLPLKLNSEDKKNIDSLCERIGYLPLVLSYMISYIIEESISQDISKSIKQCLHFIEKNITENPSSSFLERIFSKISNHLTLNARNFLIVLSYFSADAFHNSWLRKFNEIDLDIILIELKKYSLIKKNIKGRIFIHRLLQDYIRSFLCKEKRNSEKIETIFTNVFVSFIGDYLLKRESDLHFFEKLDSINLYEEKESLLYLLDCIFSYRNYLTKDFGQINSSFRILQGIGETIERINKIITIEVAKRMDFDIKIDWEKTVIRDLNITEKRYDTLKDEIISRNLYNGNKEFLVKTISKIYKMGEIERLFVLESTKKVPGIRKDFQITLLAGIMIDILVQTGDLSKSESIIENITSKITLNSLNKLDVGIFFFFLYQKNYKDMKNFDLYTDELLNIICQYSQPIWTIKDYEKFSSYLVIKPMKKNFLKRIKRLHDKSEDKSGMTYEKILNEIPDEMDENDPFLILCENVIPGIIQKPYDDLDIGGLLKCLQDKINEENRDKAINCLGIFFPQHVLSVRDCTYILIGLSKILPMDWSKTLETTKKILKIGESGIKIVNIMKQVYKIILSGVSVEEIEKFYTLDLSSESLLDFLRCIAETPIIAHSFILKIVKKYDSSVLEKISYFFKNYSCLINVSIINSISKIIFQLKDTQEMTHKTRRESALECSFFLDKLNKIPPEHILSILEKMTECLYKGIDNTELCNLCQ